MPRYRIPVDAVMLPFAALAIQRLAKTLKQRVPAHDRDSNV
jgi:hypothetical protein